MSKQYFIYLNLDGKLLSLEHVWSLVHSFFKQNITRDKWNAITQQVFKFYYYFINIFIHST